MSAQGTLDRGAVRRTPPPAVRGGSGTQPRKRTARHSAATTPKTAATEARKGAAARHATPARSAQPVRPVRQARVGASAPTRPAPAKATSAAYARREERIRKLTGGRRAAAPGTGRAQFILLVMALLATGMVLTLWLSTAAAADSYRLQEARTEARDLTEQAERLHREVASMDSAPALAQRATDLGLVPVEDPARLVVGPDGTVTLVGKPVAAAPPAPVEPPHPPAAQEPPPAQPDAAQPDAAQPDAAQAAAGAAAAAQPEAAQPGGAGG